MKIEIKNPNISKSGKSMNFQSKGKWHSMSLSLVEEKGFSMDEMNGKVILVNEGDYRLSGGWTMINSFSLAGETKIKYEPKGSSAFISDFSGSQAQSPIPQDATMELNLRTIENFHSIDPLMVEGKTYIDSYNGCGWKISESSLKYLKESKVNSVISATQNFVNRGFNSKSPNKSKYSFLVTMILELKKRSNEKLTLIIPDEIKEDVANAFADAQYFLDIYYTLAGIKNEQLDKSNIETSPKKGIKIIDSERKIFFKATRVDPKTGSPISFIRKTTIEYKDLLKNKSLVNNLLKLSFGKTTNKIQEFKDEQIKALNILMYGGGNVLAILKTGFGKSLIYQFATLLQPRVFINVFPILALINDQYKSIIDEFLLGYAISNESLRGVTDKKLQTDVLYTKRLFLVTPERLENQKMQDYFTSLGEYVGYMVFDEAHCISEWGHDFRPSYLMSKRLLENLTAAYNIKVIALTATAAPHIQKDISHLLGIPKKNIVNIADSTGLKRKEIIYDIKHIEDVEFDTWNRSEEYTKIIDQHVFDASEKFKQLIIFHMKAGAEKDVESNKYKIKISARATYQRLIDEGMQDITLFTGKQKLLNGVKKTDFNVLSSSKHIIATKSFGMGINLKECDYVLLTEPPYSLEDLYQQSGRVGRMGQDSLVEILYHDNVLMDPYLKQSPYNYFLLIKETRKEYQPLALKGLIKAISKHKGPFTINVAKFLSSIGSKASEEHLMWAMAHLITNFGIIDRYSIEYAGFRKNQIHIIPRSDLNDPRENIKTILDKMRILSETDTLDSLIDAFYENYFRRLQADKLTGINIFINKLLESDVSGKDDSEIITNVLTEYYKTRVDDVDKYVDSLMKLLIKKSSYKDIIESIENIKNGIQIFEVMESISRYEIDFEYIMTASLLLNKVEGEKMLATSWNAIISHEFKNDYLEALILRTMDDNVDHIMNNEIEHEEIKEKVDMLSILKGMNNGR